MTVADFKGVVPYPSASFDVRFLSSLTEFSDWILRSLFAHAARLKLTAFNDLRFVNFFYNVSFINSLRIMFATCFFTYVPIAVKISREFEIAKCILCNVFMRNGGGWIYNI